MMLWRLKRKLANIERRAQPDEALKLEMKKFFQGKGYFAKESAPVVSTRHFNAFQFAAVALVVVLLVSVGASSYAYASDDVLPDSILYPVKETIENLEERLAVTEAQKKEILVRHQERRLQEAKVLMNQQKPLPVLHKALLVEVKKEEQQKAEGKEMKDETLPLVKVRLEIEAKEALIREQRRAEREAQKKLEQEKRAAEKDARQDRQEERRKEEEEKKQQQEESHQQQKEDQERQDIQEENKESQDDEVKTQEEIKAELEIKTSDRSDEEKRKLLLELREKRKAQRFLQGKRRQEVIRARQKEQEAKRRALEEQKQVEIEKREAELKAEIELKARIEAEQKAIQDTTPLIQKIVQ